MKLFSYTGQGVSNGCFVLVTERSDLTAAKLVRKKLTDLGLETSKSLLDIRQALTPVMESLDSPAVIYYDNGDY